MKSIYSWIIWGYILTTLCPLTANNTTDLNSEVIPTWNVLREYTKASFNLDAHKAVCVGIISLKAQNPLQLTSFTLEWQGPHITHFSASLHSKFKQANLTERQNFAARHDNHVCNGTWDEKHQKIFFPIKEKIVSKQEYYLVLGTKNGQESSLKAGVFKLITSTKPIMSKAPKTHCSQQCSNTP